jgi:hypothetical protein
MFDVLRYQKKTNTYKTEIVREKYKRVRVDDNGLCFLCAYVALVAMPLKRKHGNHVNYANSQLADLTVNVDNPQGIFTKRKDESKDFKHTNHRETYNDKGEETTWTGRNAMEYALSDSATEGIRQYEALEACQEYTELMN